MTLEAYNADGTILGKSHMVELQFGKSVQGVPADFPSGSVTRVTFTPSTWQGDPPDLYILIPASEHKRGIFARVTTAGALQSGGAYASALPCWERQINGDILLKSDTPVSGEIFIERGN